MTPAELGAQMARLSRLAYRIVWVNPRTASRGYQPLVGGMAAALPYCDAVVSAHHLAALPELVAVVARAAVGRAAAWASAGGAATLVAARVARSRPMRDVLDELLGWWRTGEPVAMATVVGTWRSAPARRERHAGRPGRHARSAACPVAVSRARCTSWAGEVVADRHAGAGALRRQRRRRVRGGADLRRHHRDVRGAGGPATVPGAGRGRGVGGGRRAGGDRDVVRAPTGAGRAADDVWADRRSPARWARRGWTRWSPTTPAGCWPPGRTGPLPYGPDGERRGEEMTVFVAALRPAARG